MFSTSQVAEEKRDPLEPLKNQDDITPDQIAIKHITTDAESNSLSEPDYKKSAHSNFSKILRNLPENYLREMLSTIKTKSEEKDSSSDSFDSKKMADIIEGGLSALKDFERWGCQIARYRTTQQQINLAVRYTLADRNANEVQLISLEKEMQFGEESFKDAEEALRLCTNPNIQPNPNGIFSFLNDHSSNTKHGLRVAIEYLASRHHFHSQNRGAAESTSNDMKTPRRNGQVMCTPLNGYDWATDLIDEVNDLAKKNSIKDLELLTKFFPEENYEGYALTYQGVPLTYFIKNPSKEKLKTDCPTWFHGQAAIDKFWPHLENLHDEIMNFPLDRTNIESLKKFYDKLIETIWLIGNLTPLRRGTGKLVEQYLTMAHIKHGLRTPLLRLENPQLDVLHITLPLSIYKEKFFHFFESQSLLDPIVELKKNHEKTLEEELFIAASEGNIPLIKKLLRLGININALNENGESALQIAAETAIWKKNENAKNLVKFLLANQAIPENQFVKCLAKNALETSSTLPLDEKAQKIISRFQNSIDFALTNCILGPINKEKKLKSNLSMLFRNQASHSIHSRYVTAKEVRNKKRLKISFQWFYLDGAPKERDLRLLSVTDINEIKYTKLHKVEESNEPILIKQNDQFYIYGNLKGIWKFREIHSLSSDEINFLKQLPFENEIMDRNDPRFSPMLIETLNEGHEYTSFYPYMIGYQGLPLEDPKYNLTPEQSLLLTHCIYQNQGKRMGNCHAMSQEVIQHIWSNCSKPDFIPKIKRIEFVKAKTFDHYMVIINREGDLNNSDTWGDAWVIDPWYGNKGITYHASEFKQKIRIVKEYAIMQAKKLNSLNIKTGTVIDEVETLDRVICEINPEVHKYPHEMQVAGHPETFGQKDYVIENLLPYYPIKNDYQIADRFLDYQHDVKLHKNKFKLCLTEMTLFDQKKLLVTTVNGQKNLADRTDKTINQVAKKV